MYTSNRLEWHQDVDANRKTLQIPVWSCQTTNELLISVIRFVVALAKSQDHRVICRVFAFGQRNTVRQWLRLRYPDTRLARSGNVGLVLERGGEIVWDSAVAMTWLRRADIEAQANFGFDHGKAVLCSNNHQRAIMNRYKNRVIDYYKDKSPNEIAALIKTVPDFMKSEEWFVLKAQTIAKYGCTCMKCKKIICNWTQINVDHIKPRKYYPHLQNDPDNLQILCGNCNKEKGNQDTDYRSTLGRTIVKSKAKEREHV
jgi:5-methylcytosine-specific restriction endonuclease McrA